MSHCPFTYRIREDEVVELAVNRPNYEPQPPIWLELGRVDDVLENVETPEEFAWRHFHKGICWDGPSFGTPAGKTADAERRAKNEARNAEVTFRLLSQFGLRVRDDSNWRALSFNRVLHAQFGPAITAATNGVDVLLLSAPSLTADMMLVHRTNVIGPVTGTPHLVSEWDYVTNRLHTAGASLRNGAPKPPTKAERIRALCALEIL